MDTFRHFLRSLSFSSIKEISWRKVLPTFLSLVVIFNTFSAFFLFLHVREDIDHGTFSISQEQQAQSTVSLDTQYLHGHSGHQNFHSFRFHAILFVIFFVASLPLLLWITVVVKRNQDDRRSLLNERRRVRHLNTVLQTFIQIHRFIDQVTEKQHLLQKCCDILVASRGYSSAWILLLDNNGKVTGGAASGLLHNFTVFRQHVDQGDLPFCVRECLKNSQNLITISTPSSVCGDCSLADGYQRAGIMCAGLCHNAIRYGFVTVSLSSDFSQDQKEHELFSELVSDIGYALFALDQQEDARQGARALLASEERLQKITDFAHDAIVMMDHQGAISYWNSAAEQIFGYGREEVMHKNLHALLAPTRYQASHVAAFPEFVRSGGGNAIGKTIELAAVRKDGREIPVTVSLSGFLQDGNWHAIGIVRDITDNKLMEERMLQTEKLTTIAGLAAGVAHEINTPLSAILQSIQVIRQSLSPELAKNQEVASQCGLDLMAVQNYFHQREIDFFMDGIRESAIKSGKIIAELLQFSSPRKLEFSMEDLTILLDKSVDLAKNDYMLKKKYNILRVEFVREYAQHLPPLLCVAVEIEQVFINILQNAVQAVSGIKERKPRITLRSELHGESIRITIEDNGMGMDEGTKRRIFEPFFTTKEVGQGTGLGLSVAYTLIVVKHGGKLSVDSVPDQGTIFFIDLPLHHKQLTIPGGAPS